MLNSRHAMHPTRTAIHPLRHRLALHPWFCFQLFRTLIILHYILLMIRPIDMATLSLNPL